MDQYFFFELQDHPTQTCLSKLVITCRGSNGLEKRIECPLVRYTDLFQLAATFSALSKRIEAETK